MRSALFIAFHGVRTRYHWMWIRGVLQVYMWHASGSEIPLQRSRRWPQSYVAPAYAYRNENKLVGATLLIRHLFDSGNLVSASTITYLRPHTSVKPTVFEVLGKSLSWQTRLCFPTLLTAHFLFDICTSNCSIVKAPRS